METATKTKEYEDGYAKGKNLGGLTPAPYGFMHPKPTQYDLGLRAGYTEAQINAGFSAGYSAGLGAVGTDGSHVWDSEPTTYQSAYRDGFNAGTAAR